MKHKENNKSFLFSHEEDRGEKRFNCLHLSSITHVFFFFLELLAGAIDASEMLTAFNVLGMHAKKSEVEAMLAEVDADGSGEVSSRILLGPQLILFFVIVFFICVILCERKKKGKEIDNVHGKWGLMCAGRIP
jgi:hypothetical protein